MTADELWDAYEADRTSVHRDALIVHYQPLVRQIAGKMISGLPSAVELGDLMSWGNLGLIDAIGKFDPTLQDAGYDTPVKFEGYAGARIRGAILDELRRLDWVPRKLRAKARQLAVLAEQLEAGLGRVATGHAYRQQERATARGGRYGSWLSAFSTRTDGRSHRPPRSATGPRRVRGEAAHHPGMAAPQP